MQYFFPETMAMWQETERVIAQLNAGTNLARQREVVQQGSLNILDLSFTSSHILALSNILLAN